MTETTILPTKKQRQLLDFIAGFIAEHGYSPSYREVMVALHYNSVATVALHVNSLIKRGHIRKRDRSARSLEIIQQNPETPRLNTNQIKAADEKWLIEKVEHFFRQAEAAAAPTAAEIDRLYVLIGALKVLGLDGAAQSYVPRLTALKHTKTL